VAHAHHFLERLDRVTREQTEFALGLYRDHEAVKFVLEHLSIPEGVERMALTIGPDVAIGPYVIVSRDGFFVTCLGEGMTTGSLPVFPRAQIDSLLAKVADKRARREIAERELRPHEEEESIFQRVVSRGSRLAKEDYVALSAFEAMLGTSPYMMMNEFAIEVIDERPGASNVKKVHAGIAKAVEKHDKLTWAVAHLALLSGAGERKTLDKIVELRAGAKASPTYLCSAQMGHTFLMRSAWLAARLGKAMLPTYREAFENPEADWIGIFESALCIGAIGLRHASAFADARRILGAQLPLANANPKDTRLVGRAAFGEWVGKAMDEADDNTERAIKCGQTFCVTFTEQLPDGHPLKYTEEAAVPKDLARTAVLSWDADAYNGQVHTLTISAVALAARAAAEDFYLPREVVRAWHGPWDVEEALFRLSRFSDHRDKQKKEPVRAAPAPGRNDPCPCGSGKKWKKCHGSGAAAPGGTDP
jgi:hypothetical protein